MVQATVQFNSMSKFKFKLFKMFFAFFFNEINQNHLNEDQKQVLVPLA